MKRRLPGFCHLCGDPAVDNWHCAAHVWASPKPSARSVRSNGIGHITREHAYWIKRFTPEQIAELGACLGRT